MAKQMVMTIELASDGGNVAALATIAGQVEGLQSTIHKIVQRSAQAQAAVFQTLAQVQMASAERAFHHVEEQLARADRHAKQAAAERAEEARRVALAHEQAQARISQGWENIHEGIKGVLDGSLGITKSLATLGLVGEQELKQFSSVLEKVEAGATVIKGALDVSAGAGKLYSGYKAVSTGGATAASALSGGAAGTQALAALAIPAAKFGLIVGGIAVGGKVLWETLSGSADQLDSWTNKIGEAEAGVGNFIGKLFGFDPQGDKKTERMQAAYDENVHSRIEARNAGREKQLIKENLREQLAEIDREQVIFRSGTGTSGVARQIAENGAATHHENQQFDAADERIQWAALAKVNEGEAEVARVSALATQEQSLRRLIELEKEGGQLRQQQAHESIDAAKQELELQHQLLDKLRTRIDSQKNQLMSAQERLAQVDPVTALRIGRGIDDAREGKELDRSTANLLRQYRIGEFDSASQKAVYESDQNQLSAIGLARVFDLEKGRISDSEAEADAISKKLGQKSLEIKNVEEAANRIADSVQGVINERFERLISVINSKFEDGKNDAFQQRGFHDLSSVQATGEN